MKKNLTFISDISKKEFKADDKISAKTLRNQILSLIQSDFPDFDEKSFLTIEELNLYREKYISNYLSVEIGELTNLENKVIGSLQEDMSIVSSLEEDLGIRTFGQKVADNVAAFGGSWKFIILFVIFILFWILANIYFSIKDLIRIHLFY